MPTYTCELRHADRALQAGAIYGALVIPVMMTLSFLWLSYGFVYLTARTQKRYWVWPQTAPRPSMGPARTLAYSFFLTFGVVTLYRE